MLAISWDISSLPLLGAWKDEITGLLVPAVRTDLLCPEIMRPSAFSLLTGSLLVYSALVHRRAVPQKWQTVASEEEWHLGSGYLDTLDEGGSSSC